MPGKMTCSQEDRVAEAARLDRWDEALKNHLAGCAHCAGLARAVDAMQSISASTDTASRMPEASRIWCLALLDQKHREATRARRTLAAAHLAIMLLVALGFVGWLWWRWPQLEPQLSAWREGLFPRLLQAAWFLAQQMPRTESFQVPFLLAALAAATVLLLRPLLADDTRRR